MAYSGGTSGYQAGAQANDVVVSHALEAVYGVVPTGFYQADRLSGENFRKQKTRSRPDELTTFGESSRAVTTQESVSGTLSGALSTTTYDDLIAGTMLNDWTAAFSETLPSGAKVVPAIASNQASYVFTASATVSGALAIGQWVRIAGFSNPGNNGLFQITMTYPVVSGQQGYNFWCYNPNAVAETATGAVSVTSNGFLTNGTLFKSFTVREKMAGSWLHRAGGFITKSTFTWQQGQFASCSFDTSFASEIVSSTDVATLLVSAPTGSVQDTVRGFQGVYVDGLLLGNGVKQAGITLARDGAAQDYAMGSAAAVGQRPGSLMATGSLQTFFKDYSLYTRFVNETYGPLTVVTQDGSGSGYALTFLNSTLQNPQINAGSKNSAIMASFDIEGNPQSAGGTFTITRF